MRMILEQLYEFDWHKEILAIPLLDGQRETREEAFCAYEKLKKALDSEMRELFEDFIAKNISVCAFEDSQAFMKGFVLASKLFAELYLKF